MNKIKVLIVDDSALVRQFLSETLSGDNGIEVIGTAMDPVIAFTKIMKVKPDVITLDVEMPKMDGLTFLDRLMQSYPIPVVMISSLTQRGCETTMKALELGAVDFVTKPERNLYGEMDRLKEEVIRKVKNAAAANVKTARSHAIESFKGVDTPDLYGQVEGDFQGKPGSSDTIKMIVIGASTGGVTAVRRILGEIDARSVAVLTVLHMPGGFTTSFARSLDNVLEVPVKEVVSGDIVRQGHVYVAPGNKNVTIEKTGSGFKFAVDNCTPDDIYRPSIDKTFISAARTIGRQTLAIILTGMGDDGARGMTVLRRTGSYTIAQDKDSSIVFGMPRRAIQMGGVTQVLHLDQIAKKVNSLIYKANTIKAKG